MVPNGWSECSLAESCKKPISYGIVQTGPDIPLGVPCVRVVDLTNRVLCTENMITTSHEVHRSYKKTILERGELMMALRGEIGLVRSVDPTIVGANITRGIARLSPQEAIVDSDYLLWAMRSEQVRKNLLAKAGGSALQEISLTALRKLTLLLPPLPEQRKIAKILQTWDRAIATTEKLIDASKQQKKALMQQLMTGKKRFPGFEEEWKSTNVREISKLITKGTTPSTNGFQFQDSGIPFIKVECITRDGSVDMTKAAYIDDRCHSAFNRSQLKPGDVLFSIAGALGRVALVPDDLVEANTNQAVCLIRISDSNISKEFLYYYLQTGETKKTVIAKTAQAAQPNLSLKNVGDFKLSVPTSFEQQKITNMLKSADNQIVAAAEDLRQLKQEKKALMQQLLTGKRRVKVDD